METDAPQAGIGPARRFDILRRDSFACAYCNACPGNDSLNVDHIVPRCVGGSDHDNNLITTCAKCNNGKGGRVCVPLRMCEPARDRDGWVTWKRWGAWSLKWNPQPSERDEDDTTVDDVVLSCVEFGGEYWIGLSSVHEEDWPAHMREKTWVTPPVLADFCTAVDFVRTLVEPEA